MPVAPCGLTWTIELEATVAHSHDQSHTHADIDECLRDYIEKASRSYQSQQVDFDAVRCADVLLGSSLFADHRTYVQRQFVYGLLQEDDAAVLHVIAAVLLLDGRADGDVFDMMRAEGAFPVLLSLIRANKDDDMSLHRLLLELLCDMSSVQRLSCEDLGMLAATVSRLL